MQDSFINNFRAAFPAARQAQLNQLKISNNIRDNFVSDDEARYIVNNTYQVNRDGTSYGIGHDGIPYSYTLNGARVSNINPLGTDEQIKLINDYTDGRVKVDKSVASPQNIAWILTTLKRMDDYKNGYLTPGKVTIKDTKALPEGYGKLPSSVAGVTFFDPQMNDTDEVYLRDTDDPEGVHIRDFEQAKSGRSSAYGRGAHVTAHELAHAANFNTDDLVRRLVKDANKFSYLNDERVQNSDYINNLFEEAAKKSGFDSVDTAMKSISDYAGEGRSEAFAEAYTDVLFNKDDAKPFSKELVSMASDTAEKWAGKIGVRGKENEKLMEKAKNSLPQGTFLPSEVRFDKFRRNWELNSN